MLRIEIKETEKITKLILAIYGYINILLSIYWKQSKGKIIMTGINLVLATLLIESVYNYLTWKEYLLIGSILTIITTQVSEKTQIKEILKKFYNTEDEKEVQEIIKKNVGEYNSIEVTIYKHYKEVIEKLDIKIKELENQYNMNNEMLMNLNNKKNNIESSTILNMIYATITNYPWITIAAISIIATSILYYTGVGANFIQAIKEKNLLLTQDLREKNQQIEKITTTLKEMNINQHVTEQNIIQIQTKNHEIVQKLNAVITNINNNPIQQTQEIEKLTEKITIIEKDVVKLDQNTEIVKKMKENQEMSQQALTDLTQAIKIDMELLQEQITNLKDSLQKLTNSQEAFVLDIYTKLGEVNEAILNIMQEAEIENIIPPITQNEELNIIIITIISRLFRRISILRGGVGLQEKNYGDEGDDDPEKNRKREITKRNCEEDYIPKVKTKRQIIETMQKNRNEIKTTKEGIEEYGIQNIKNLNKNTPVHQAYEEHSEKIGENKIINVTQATQELSFDYVNQINLNFQSINNHLQKTTINSTSTQTQTQTNMNSTLNNIANLNINTIDLSHSPVPLPPPIEITPIEITPIEELTPLNPIPYNFQIQQENLEAILQQTTNYNIDGLGAQQEIVDETITASANTLINALSFPQQVHALCKINQQEC